MRSFLSLLLVLCLCPGSYRGVRAQTPTYGIPEGNVRQGTALLGVSDMQTLDQMMFFIPGIGSPASDLARQNIKSYMMPIRKAPNANMEWAYALAGGLEYYLNLNNNFKDNLSPDFIALSLARSGTAPNIEDGLKHLVQQGTVSAAIVPYGSTTIPNAVYSVPKFNIANYGYLFRPETRPRNKVFEAKKALTRGNPVIVQLSTDAGFSNLKRGSYATNTPGAELHYLTVVGFDNQNQFFELRGIQGRDWGEAGYVRISFDNFGRLAQTGYVLIPKLAK
ncbi:MAG: C1 family peptidase [Bacteroidota bacterium]